VLFGFKLGARVGQTDGQVRPAMWLFKSD